MVDTADISDAGPVPAAGADGAAEDDPNVNIQSSSPTAVRQELQRVLDSTRFDASARNRRFLEYVIEETLAGRGRRIKAYNIATEVFGRDVDFDPQLDPVVRMEARRLRRSLERFYLTDGKGSVVRIAMPKGGYVPEFQNVMLSSPAANASRDSTVSEAVGTERASAILVTQFDAEGDQSVFLNFNRGFTEQVLIGLARFPDISVFGPSPVVQHAPAADREYLPSERNVDFILTGSTALFGGFLSVTVVLVDARNGRVRWGQSFEREFQSGNPLCVRDDVANSIVRALARPYGAIFNSKSKAAEATDLAALSPLECIIRFYEYGRTFRRDLFSNARECLERTVIDNPDYPEAFACLSRLYTDGHRFGFATDSPSRLRQQATEFAQRAVELAPDSSRGYHALGLACWFEQDVSTSIHAMRTALDLNPNATEVMTDLGLIWSLLGEWCRGVPLLEEASAREPIQLGASRIGLSLYHFVNGRYEDALAKAYAVDMPDVTDGLVARAISLVRLGRKAEASQVVRRIVELAPLRSHGVLGDLTGVNTHPELASKVLAALRDAGLPTEFTRH